MRFAPSGPIKFAKLTLPVVRSYIPLRVDYTDLFDIMSFFTGDLEGRNAHPELGKQIADQGKEYAEKYWRYADMETCA